MTSRALAIEKGFEIGENFRPNIHMFGLSQLERLEGSDLVNTYSAYLISTRGKLRLLLLILQRIVLLILTKAENFGMDSSC